MFNVNNFVLTNVSHELLAFQKADC